MNRSDKRKRYKQLKDKRQKKYNKGAFGYPKKKVEDK
jgi:hypothetical protein